MLTQLHFNPILLSVEIVFVHQKQKQGMMKDGEPQIGTVSVFIHNLIILLDLR